jgi:hypothetical protein
MGSLMKLGFVHKAASQQQGNKNFDKSLLYSLTSLKHIILRLTIRHD